MFLLRLIGGWCILAAVVALVNDLTLSYQTGAKLTFASLGKDWEAFGAQSLTLVQAAIEKHVARGLWDPAIVTLLKAPAFGAFAVLGVLLYLVGLRRRKLNIYAN